MIVVLLVDCLELIKGLKALFDILDVTFALLRLGVVNGCVLTTPEVEWLVIFKFEISSLFVLFSLILRFFFYVNT